MNAAVWFGGTVAITFVALTGFFSDEMKELFNRKDYWTYYAGGVAQIIFSHVLMLQCWCGMIALGHLLGEVFYLGRAVARFRLWVLIMALALTFFGAFIATPKLKQLRQTKYFGESQQLKQTANDHLGKWHSATQLANLLVIVSVGIYFWSTISWMDSPRFSRATKFNG